MYSYNDSTVSPVLIGRVGWREDACLTLSDANKASKSGRFFNDGSFHSLVTLKNIFDTMENADANQLEKQAYLQSLTTAAVRKVLSVFNTGESLSYQLLFERFGRQDLTVANNGSFVGYKFRVANDVQLACQLHAVRLLFTANAVFTLYLFQDGIPAPLKAVSVSATARQLTDVELTDWILTPGVYYAGYFQDDLGAAQAVHENVNRWNPFFGVSAFPVMLKKTATERIDENTEYGGGFTYGLNFTLSTFSDYTQRIIRNQAQFDSAIGYAMACTVLQMIVNSTASNSTERKLKDVVADASYDLNGSIPVMGVAKKQGLLSRLEEELGTLRTSFFPPAKAQSVSLCLS